MLRSSEMCSNYSESGRVGVDARTAHIPAAATTAMPIQAINGKRSPNSSTP